MDKNSYPKRIYLSASWKPDDRPLTERVANLLAARGVTVVRDHEVNKNEDPLRAQRTWAKRINSMMRDCSGLVVVMSYNSNSRQTTSPYLIPELLSADSQNIPILLFANPKVEISRTDVDGGAELRFGKSQEAALLNAAEVFEIGPSGQAEMENLVGNANGFLLKRPRAIKGPLPYPNDDKRATEGVIEDFVADCPIRDPYPFVFNILPFSLKDSIHQTIAAEVFKATGMACHISLDSITGETSVRRNWQAMLAQAELIIAELSSLRETCLFETGCAIGLKKRVFVLSKKGQQALPFGLDDQTFHQYESLNDLTQYVRDTCCKDYRREVFNLTPELEKDPKVTSLGIPNWLDKSGGFDLDKRLTASIWTICLSLTFAIQSSVILLWPSAPKPNMLAMISVCLSVLGLTRIGRESWERRIGKFLSWLPWVGFCSVVALVALLTVLMTAKLQTPSNPPSAPPANSVAPK